jgi:dTDP-glucose pyrophosphorylase/CBS domain-containing protein
LREWNDDVKEKSWKDVLVPESATLEDAIRLMESTAKRILVVVGKKDLLKGTVTDGDIRRGILKRVELSQPIVEIMNPNPVAALYSESDEEILSRIKKDDLLHIPIVNDDSEVVGLKTIQDFFEKTNRLNPVVLMAGGFGSRLRPLTEEIPKPLLNVGDRPILETIMNQFVENGFSKFFISTHYKSEQIIDHFGNGEKWGVCIEYLKEEYPLGTAGVLSLLPDGISDLPLIVMNGDVLSNVDFQNLLRFHATTGSDCTIAVKQLRREIPYGVVETQDGWVTDIVEKPVYSNFVNAGIYVISQSVIAKPKRPVYQDMPVFLKILIKEKRKVSAFAMHEYWLDIGRLSDYERANREIESLLGSS